MRVEGTGENRLACRNVMRSLVVLDVMAALAWSGANAVGSMRQRPLGRKCGRSAVTALAWRCAGGVGALAGSCMRQRPLASRGPEKRGVLLRVMVTCDWVKVAMQPLSQS